MMIARIWLRFVLFLTMLGMLVACGGAGAGQPTATGGATSPTDQPDTALPPVATAAPSALPQATLAAAPTAPQPAATAVAGAIPEGLTDEGYHFLGRADASATLEMYSDFL